MCLYVESIDLGCGSVDWSIKCLDSDPLQRHSMRGRRQEQRRGDRHELMGRVYAALLRRTARCLCRRRIRIKRRGGAVMRLGLLLVLFMVMVSIVAFDRG